jgi:hypothetical protein
MGEENRKPVSPVSLVSPPRVAAALETAFETGLKSPVSTAFKRSREV